MSKKVLVTGSTGNIGSLLLKQLAEDAGLTVHGLVRSDEKAAQVRASGAEAVLGSFEDPESIDAAVADVDTIVLITPPNPVATDQASTVIKAAKAAGVRKIVRVSALKAAADGPTDNTRQHAQTEDELAKSGLVTVVLRPQLFMPIMFMAVESIVKDNNFYLGMGDGKMGMIDVRDVADCVAACVVSDDHDGQTIELTGPSSISFHDAATTLSSVLGRTITYIPVPPAAVFSSIQELGWGDWMAGILRDYSQAYSDGWGDYTTDGVARLTGHPARSFEDFTREVFAPALAA